MHSNPQAYNLGLPLIPKSPPARVGGVEGLLEPDVCGEESEANFGIHIEPKCDSAICVELRDAPVSLAQ